MKFLLTNDDGYNAQGILLLKDKLLKYGEVTIVAPFEHMSAKSASITLGDWLKVDRIMKTPMQCMALQRTVHLLL